MAFHFHAAPFGIRSLRGKAGGRRCLLRCEYRVVRKGGRARENRRHQISIRSRQRFSFSSPTPL
eukprot:322353-Prymnesium_polylepis.1